MDQLETGATASLKHDGPKAIESTPGSTILPLDLVDAPLARTKLKTFAIITALLVQLMHSRSLGNLN